MAAPLSPDTYLSVPIAGTPHEAVIQVAAVNVVPCDRARLVDALRACALAGACARVRCVELGEGAVTSTHVA